MAKRPNGDAGSWEPLDLLHRARGADAKSAWSLLDHAFAKAGFEQSFYAFGVPMSSRQPVVDKLKRGILGGGPPVNGLFQELARHPDLMASEPVAPHCKRSLEPFVWSHTELKARDPSPLRLAREFAIRSFVVFPLRDADATHYGNFTITCGDDKHEGWLAHARRFAPLLHVTAQYFHDTLAGLDATTDTRGPTLSPRQRECLLWASCGLGTKQIAERLGLSEPVVNEYLHTAKRRLGCKTRSHAVARAIRLGIITP